jgi:dUTP pyrophosphatase
MKVTMNDDEVLLVVVRSSMGFKYNIRMCNQVGVMDKDYYNNPNNEGHMWIALKNEGDKEYTVEKGEAFAQGMFIKYLTVDDEEEITKERTGGFGSTNKE